MGAIKTDKEIPLDSVQIQKNINELITKLGKDSTELYVELCSRVGAVSVQDLTWKDPLASQVISDQSELVKGLSSRLKKGFEVGSHNTFIEGSLRINI